MTSLRRTAAAGVASLALLAVPTLAACGGGNDKPSSSSSHSASSSSSGSTASSGSTSSALAQKIQKTFSEGRSAHVTLDMGDTGNGQGDVDFASSKPAMDLTISGGQAGNTELRLVDGKIYVKSSAMGGDKWIKLDSNALGQTGFDPSKMFDSLKDLKGGTDLGGGHWKVDEGGGISADLYFKGDLLEKSVVTGAGSSPITLTYSDWGKKVSVTAPPADQVMEMPSMGAPNIPSMSPQ